GVLGQVQVERERAGGLAQGPYEPSEAALHAGRLSALEFRLEGLVGGGEQALAGELPPREILGDDQEIDVRRRRGVAARDRAEQHDGHEPFTEVRAEQDRVTTRELQENLGRWLRRRRPHSNIPPELYPARTERNPRPLTY